MKKLRVLAIIILVLLVADFGYIVFSLIQGNYTAFYLGGGVLVGLLILGFVLKKARENMEKRQKEAGEEEAEKL